MTEKEAKTKWCPHDRHYEHYGNNFVSINTHANCIASDCMMWKWLLIEGTTLPSKGNLVKRSIASKDIGYCGLSHGQ